MERKIDKKTRTTSFYSVSYYKDGIPLYIQHIVLTDKNVLVELDYTPDKRFALKFKKETASYYAIVLEKIYHIKHYTPYNAAWDATKFTDGLYHPTENMMVSFANNHSN